VHVLVNDAAIAPRHREETPEGIEVQLATNVLGYLWMAQSFRDALAAGARASGEPSRVVNVASYWAGDLDVDDLEFRRRPYDNDTAYRQSKQANRMLTVVQAEQLAEANIVVNACHPGDVNSKLSNDLGFGGHESPEGGARTPVWLATSSELVGVSGRYFERCAEQRCRFGSDKNAVSRLAERCAKYES
jgi:NAD(P)-dependent dehydrogenase (short-subunit alcohol dehydrogenase family)